MHNCPLSPVATGASLPGTSSNASNPPAGRGPLSLTSAEWAFLVTIGLCGVLAHASINLPLKLPGHHGLEWMALLMFARTVAPSTWAATVAATSAAGFASVPIWGFHATTIGLSYLLSGFVVDALYRAFRMRGVSFAACCAALAHLAKPLWKWAAVVGAGASFGSIEAGIGYSLLTHMAFGLVGGAAGALAGRALLARHGTGA